ncbi:MAG: 30S ribosomal protein S6 [Phycisphaerales bacterium]|jgi:small subunit ribosomal protein S6|nr:30S ribosomal protein S6 [Phycisphaerales bacterium]MDP6890391.1 30S ribosomal protein S6 [Phycisphaerales bacterium]
MSEITINNYEAMFLFPQSTTANLGEASEHVLAQLEKVGAEVISFRKWDDRRLAFPIKGNKRGVFFLGYFKLPGDKMAGLERNLLLSEEIVRFLITRADHLSQEQMEAAEGRAELADEIKLRGEQQSDEAASSIRATTKAERDAVDVDEVNGGVPEENAPLEETMEAVETEETTAS